MNVRPTMVAAVHTLFATTLLEASLARVLLGTLETGCHVLVKLIRYYGELIVKQSLLTQNNTIEFKNIAL